MIERGILPTGLMPKIRTAMQLLGQAIFQKSQEYVPVKSGQLRDSGKLTTGLSGGGFNITYGAPHASFIHDGREKELFKGNYISQIPEHKRRLPGKIVTVRAHTKTYRNMKPVLSEDGNWYTLANRSSFKGTKFLEKAFREEWTQANLWKYFPKKFSL
tara:strand:- start:102 stop:575 length:474 start_codon:yes stop_codon:yes gene_type:complete